MQNRTWQNKDQRRGAPNPHHNRPNRGPGQGPSGRGMPNRGPNNGHRHHHNNNGGQQRFDRPRFQRPPQKEVESPAEVKFFSGTSIDPAPRIHLTKGLSEPTIRAMDLLCPIGKGQRGLIVSPPKSGKTTFLKHICQAITGAEPEMKVYVLLIDERPEEVTDFRRSVTAEVRWSTSDQPYENHIAVAKQLMKDAIEHAAEGKHVMILIDSLTRLARVHNSAVRGHGRTLSGGVDAQGLIIPRKIFGTARNIEFSGSIGILATILVQTGSRMDDVIFQEFKGTGNMELVLSREVSDRRIFPALNIRESGTRKEEKLFTPEELKASRTLRAALASMSEVESAQALTELLRKYPTNEAIVASLQ
ncbi:MAG: Transcription termination factor Rho [Elusimicrobia bacterium]|nr:Transcription termination factor Rho [Elusimicrobiota bacterium]